MDVIAVHKGDSHKLSEIPFGFFVIFPRLGFSILLGKCLLYATRVLCREKMIIKKVVLAILSQAGGENGSKNRP